MIYLDNAATTRPYAEVLEMFSKVSLESFANTSSTHAIGRASLRRLDDARNHIKTLLNLQKTHEMIFTSCASESNNLIIKGIAHKYSNRGKRVITSEVEHPSVLNAFKELESEGFDVVFLHVNKDGYVDPLDLEKAMNKETILVSIMAVNNEVGSIFPVGKYAEIVHKYPKAFFHSDATQSMGKVKVDYSKIDLISFSSHKIGGLKGNGALLYKKSIQLAPLLDGGEQEFGIRAGTVDLAGSICMDLALTKTLKEMGANIAKVTSLKCRLLEGLSTIEEVTINSPINSSPFVLNFSLENHKSSVVLEALSQKEIYVSSVSACSSKGEPISYVLLALSKTEVEARNSIRVSVSPNNTEEEIDTFITTLKNILATTAGREFVK
ncbi:MAG: cysteine desulfurase [Bacilli bacterium]|nr:cysteine desulfurase [Bacilli bacterium]